MKLVKFQDVQGDDLFVNADDVSVLEDNSGGMNDRTRIWMKTGRNYRVQGTPQATADALEN